jgi:hypothetical protein
MSKVVSFVMDPIASIIGGKTGQAISGATKIVAGAVTGNFQLVAIGLSQMASGLTRSPARQASGTSLSIGEASREAVFGEAVVGGSLSDCFNYGGKYGTDWEVLIITLADHLCEGLVGFFVKDKYVAFTGDGMVQGYKNQLQVFFRPGTENQALPAIVTQYGPGWTPNDNGAGVCYVVVGYKADEADAKDPVWTSGRPTFRWRLKGAKCYQARKDSSVGGSGAHRWDNPATWEWSENPIDCRYNWARGIFACNRVNDPNMLLVGRGLTAIEAPPANVFARANLCDELVNGEPRYRVGGFVRSLESYLETEDMFASACAGIIVQPEGCVEIDPGQAKVPVVAITDDDFVIGSTVEYSDCPSEADREWVNTVIARYVEPAQNWVDHAAPILRANVDVVADGRPREETLGLALVHWAKQAQRVGEIRRRLGRLHRRAAFTLGPRFCELEEGDWLAWTSPRRFAGSRAFRIEAFRQSEKRQTSLRVREIHSTVYTEGAFAPDGATAQQPVPPPAIGQPAANAWAVAAQLLASAGGSIPALVVTGAADDPYAAAIIFEYWLSDGVTPPANAAAWTVAGTVPRNVTRFEITSLAPGAAYYVAVSYLVSGEPGTRRILGPFVAGVLTSGTFVGAGSLATRNNVHFGSSYLLEAADGTPATLPAFKTGLGTAAAITGQGTLATRSNVVYGTSDVSGFGTLAGRASVHFGSSYLLEAADGTPATLPAFKTGLGTAAAIAGQGTGATASTLAQLNTTEGSKLAGIEAGATATSSATNVKNSTFFDYPNGTGLPANWVNNGAASLNNVTRVPGLGGRYSMQVSPPAGGTHSVSQAVGGAAMQTAAGGQALSLEVDLQLTAGVLTGSAARVDFYSSAGAYVGRAALVFSAETDPLSGVPYGAGTVGREYRFRKHIVMPAGAFWYGIWADTADASWGSIAAARTITWRRVEDRVVSEQEHRAAGMETGANKTETRIAAAIFGQGTLATRSSVAYGTSDVSGFGTLAGRGAVHFGSPFLLEADGGAQATLTAFKTGLGTSAGITGQGALATRNYVSYGTSDVLGFGTLAGRGAVHFGSPYLLEADGGAQATLTAFKTGLGTAAAITGQGTLATRSNVVYGTSDVSGFGTLAGRAAVHFGSPFLLEVDGGAQATLNAFKTGLGTAAAITGQGTLATKSAVDLESDVTNKGRIGKIGAGGRVTDPTFYNTAALIGPRNVTNLLPGQSAGVSNVMVNIPAHSRKIAGAAGAVTLNYGAGSGAVAFGAAWHCYTDDPDLTGNPSPTYTFTSNADDLLHPGRYHVASGVAPAAGGTGGSTGSGGGSGGGSTGNGSGGTYIP